MNIFILIFLLEEFWFPIYGNSILKFRFKSQVVLNNIINNSTSGIWIWEHHKDGTQMAEVRGDTLLMQQRPTGYIITQKWR